MTDLLRIFSPLRQVAAVFFMHELTLRRGAGGIQLTLAAPETSPRAGARRARRRGDEPEAGVREETALIVQQLGALLDAEPESRLTLRHLVFVEDAVRRTGLRALAELPLQVLRRAHLQLEGLVVNWSPVGLANLRSKMAVAIVERSRGEVIAPREPAVVALDTTPIEQPEVLEQDDDEALAAVYAAVALNTGGPETAAGLRGH